MKESDLLVERGKEAMGREQYDEAINLFRKAKDKGASAGEIDGLVRKCLNKIRERECRRLVIQGERAFSAKKWSECVKHLKAVVKLGCATHDMEKKLRTCIINE